MSIQLQSSLADPIPRFITYKRALGRSYHTEASALRLLDRYLAEEKIRGPEETTPSMIEAFMASRPRRHPRSYNHLLGTVRRFFEWLVIQEELARSPVQLPCKRVTSHRLPFILEPVAIRRLLALARQLPDNPRAPMRGVTYHTIFAILYGLGLRVSEVCGLEIGDVDLERELLVIRRTKFYKSRLVPFGPRMAAELRAYLQVRRTRVAPAQDAPLFSFTKRGAVHPAAVGGTFRNLVPKLGLSIPPGHLPVRLHDLRHAFAVGTVLRWYREGSDPGSGLLKLATFMGHVDVDSTTVYLRMTDALLTEANRRFETFAEPVLAGGLSL